MIENLPNLERNGKDFQPAWLSGANMLNVGGCFFHQLSR